MARYLTSKEREEIKKLSSEGLKISEIATKVGRSPSTVRRCIYSNYLKTLPRNNHLEPTLEQVIQVLNYLLQEAEDLRHKKEEYQLQIAKLNQREFWAIYGDLKKGK